MVSSDMGSPLAPHTNPSPERVKNGKSMMLERVFGLLRDLKRVSPKNMILQKRCCRNAVIHSMPPGMHDPEKVEEVFLC